MVKGRFRDKMELIKVAAAKAQKELGYRGTLDVIKVEDYDPELEGHIVVVELRIDGPLGSKDRLVVPGREVALD